MGGWILAALIGAVPLSFGFGFGRRRTGTALLTGIGVMLSLVVLGLLVATNTGGQSLILAGLGLAYLAGVAALGTLAGVVARFVFGMPEDRSRR